MISLRFLYASCRSLALLARVVGDSSNPPKLCVISAAIQSSPPSASFGHSDHRAETYAVHVLLRSPRRKLLCRDIGLSLRRRRLPRYRVCAEEWLSRLKVLSKCLARSLIRRATFRHPVCSRTTWALQVSIVAFGEQTAASSECSNCGKCTSAL